MAGHLPLQLLAASSSSPRPSSQTRKRLTAVSPNAMSELAAGSHAHAEAPDSSTEHSAWSPTRRPPSRAFSNPTMMMMMAHGGPAIAFPVAANASHSTNATSTSNSASTSMSSSLSASNLKKQPHSQSHAQSFTSKLKQERAEVSFRSAPSFSGPLDVVSKKSPPHVAVRYGDRIRLFARNNCGSSDGGGYVGTCEARKRLLQSTKSADKRSGLACLAPPTSCSSSTSSFSTGYHPSVFRVLSTCGHEIGTPLSYGDVIVLADENDMVWNNKIGMVPSSLNGLFSFKERNSPGEMYLSFYQLQTEEDEEQDGDSSSSEEDEGFLFFNQIAKTTKNITESHFGTKSNNDSAMILAASLRTIGKIVYYGDRNIIIDVADSNRMRSKFNRVLTQYCRSNDTHSVKGDFLRCDGRGKTVFFEMHGLPAPTIESISLVSSSNDDQASSKLPYQRRKSIFSPSQIEYGDMVELQHVTRSSKVSVRFSDGSSTRIAFTTLLESKEKPLYRIVKNGLRPARIMVQAKRSKGHQYVRKFGRALHRSHRELFKLFGSVLLGYLSVTYAVSHVMMREVFFPACYVAIAASVIGLIAEVMRPGLIVELPTAIDEADHTDKEALGNWDFSVLMWEASESERVGKTVDLHKKSSTPDSPIPKRFIVSENGDLIKAKDRYEKTLAWRAEIGADSILSTPQHHFHTIKRLYKQYLHKHDKLGHPVYYEKLGSINMKQMQKAGVTNDVLLQHYIFSIEFALKYAATGICECEACVESETRKLFLVLDAKGLGVRDLGGETFEFVRKCSGLMQRHYPQRSFKIFLVNVPGWFGLSWKGIRPLLNETTRAKTNILSESDTPAGLLEWIEAKDLPVEYGGECTCDGECAEDSYFQKLQRALVDSVIGSKPFSVEAFERGSDADKENGGSCWDSIADVVDEYVSESDVNSALKDEKPPHSSQEGNESVKSSIPPYLSVRARSNLSVRERVLCEGFLLKRSLRHQHLNPIWHRRYFLLYDESIRFGKYLECEVFQIVILTEDTVVRKTKTDNSFEIVTPLMASRGHSLLLLAASSEEFADWMEAVRKAIERLRNSAPPLPAPHLIAPNLHTALPIK